MTWVVVLVFTVAATGMIVAQDVFYSDGPSGEQCGTTRCRAAPRAASCVNGKCKCDDVPGHGIGNLECALPGERFCAIFNDPRARSFDGGRVDVPLISKTLVTNLKTQICCVNPLTQAVTQFPGWCKIKIFTWVTKRKGKTFIAGLESTIHIRRNGKDYFRRYRVYGTADSGLYTYTLDGHEDPQNKKAFGKPRPIFLSGIGLVFADVDTINNFVNIFVDTCGVQFGIRVLDTTNPYEQPAGLYVRVNDQCSPEYYTDKYSLCTAPEGEGETLEERRARCEQETGLTVSSEVAAFYGVLTCHVHQEFPNAPSNLPALYTTARGCPKTKMIEALNHCRFIIDLPRFLKCYDHTNNGFDAINILEKCLAAFALRPRADAEILCTEVQTHILDSGCDDRVPTDYTTIYALDCATFA